MPYTGVTSLAAKHPSFPWAGIKRATFTDFVAKSRTTLSRHRYSSRFAIMLQNMFHVFVAQFTVCMYGKKRTHGTH